MPSKNSKSIKKTPTQKLKDQISDFKVEIESLKDKQLRLKAEFDNYRKRKDQEIGLYFKYEGESVIKSFLNVVDDLDRLIDASSKSNEATIESLNEGILLISQKINKKFNELKVKQFGEAGDIADHELHESLLMKKDPEKKENEIIEVFEKGYRYKDKVIRHAKVVVNQTPS